LKVPVALFSIQTAFTVDVVCVVLFYFVCVAFPEGLYPASPMQQHVVAMHGMRSPPANLGGALPPGTPYHHPQHGAIMGQQHPGIIPHTPGITPPGIGMEMGLLGAHQLFNDGAISSNPAGFCRDNHPTFSRPLHPFLVHQQRMHGAVIPPLHQQVLPPTQGVMNQIQHEMANQHAPWFVPGNMPANQEPRYLLPGNIPANQQTPYIVPDGRTLPPGSVYNVMFKCSQNVLIT
jgi:hypothetical protein